MLLLHCLLLELLASVTHKNVPPLKSVVRQFVCDARELCTNTGVFKNLYTSPDRPASDSDLFRKKTSRIYLLPVFTGGGEFLCVMQNGVLKVFFTNLWLYLAKTLKLEIKLLNIT